MSLTDQPTAAPTRKVATGMVAGAGAALVGAPAAILWVWGLLSTEPMPAEVAIFVAGIFTWGVQSAVSYLTRERV